MKNNLIKLKKLGEIKDFFEDKISLYLSIIYVTERVFINIKIQVGFNVLDSVKITLIIGIKVIVSVINPDLRYYLKTLIWSVSKLPFS